MRRAHGGDALLRGERLMMSAPARAQKHHTQLWTGPAPPQRSAHCCLSFALVATDTPTTTRTPAPLFMTPPPPITHSLTRHDEQLHVDTPVGVCREWNAARPEGERYAEHM